MDKIENIETSVFLSKNDQIRRGHLSIMMVKE